MNHHQWEPIDEKSLSLKCIHCEQIIQVEDSELWNLEIFADCPNQ
jgi:hypothetical protein